MFKEIATVVEGLPTDFQRVVFRYDSEKEQKFTLLFELIDTFIIANSSSLANVAELAEVEQKLQKSFASVFHKMEKMLKHPRTKPILLLAFWIEAGELRIYLDHKNEEEFVFYTFGIGSYEQLELHPFTAVIAYYEGKQLADISFIGKGLAEQFAYATFDLYHEGVERLQYIEELLYVEYAPNLYITFLQNFDQLAPHQMNKVQLQWAVQMGRSIASEHGVDRASALLDATAYAKTFAKKIFYVNSLEYYIDLFIAHNQTNYFIRCGEKIAFTYFLTNLRYIGVLLLDKYLLQLAELQILFLEEQLTVEAFKNGILYMLYMSNI